MARKKKTGDQEPMVTMKVGFRPHTALKLLQKRYKGDSNTKPTISEALWRYIQETNPELAKEADEVAELRGKLADLLGDDNDE